MNEIVKKSRLRIKKSLNKGFVYHHLAIARSDKFLRKHDSERIPMFVLYVDLVDSTKMSSELEPEVFNTIIRTFSQEMAFVIEQFDGYVLKFVGDAVLGYFVGSNHSSSVAKNAVQCAIKMHQVIKNAINPVLEYGVYPELKVKTTIDFGECSVVRYGSDKHRSHIDLIGLTLNLAAKMQQMANPDDILIGEYVFKKLNSKDKAIFVRVKTNSKSWKYHERGIHKPYSVYVRKSKNFKTIRK